MRTVALGDLVEFYAGAGFPNDFQGFTQGELPFAKVSDISKSLEGGDRDISTANNYVSGDVARKLRAKPFPEGTIVFAKIGEAIRKNRRAITAREMLFDNNVMGIYPNAKATDVKYLVRFLDTVDFYRLANATAVPSLRKSVLGDVQIPLPPLDEQKRIAAILDKADQLRQKRRQAIALLDSLTQSIFLEMFGDPVTNPKGLPMVEFGSLIRSGPTNGLYKPSSAYGEGTRILRINNFYDGAITRVDELRRLAISFKEQQAYSLAEDDIVINRVNSREYLGKSALVPRLDEPVVFESNMMRLSLRDGEISPKYCIDFLQSQSIKQQIARNAKDAVNQSSINQTDVKSFRILLPAIAKQREYAKVALAISTRRGILARALAEGDQLFSSLQHRAFTGQL